ncbi:MAG: hypothetical protein QW717_07200 [Candidatus Bathyarchaeia archaeon]
MIGGYHLERLVFQARRLKQKVKSDTEKLRVTLLEELESMLQVAKRYVEEAGDNSQVQHWMRSVFAFWKKLFTANLRRSL